MKHDLYTCYSEFKGWTGRFRYSQYEAQYFAGEFAGHTLGGAKILDIAFGDGAFMAWAKDNDADVSGTEIDPKLISAAQKKGFLIHDSDLARLANSQFNTFDIVVAFDVLEHLPIHEIVETMRQVNILLKPQGYFFVRTPNGQSPFGRVLQYGDITHSSVLSVDKFRQLALMTGFELTSSRNSYRLKGSHWVRRGLNSVRFLGRDFVEIAISRLYGLQRLPLDPNITVVLRKNYDKREYE